MGVCDRRAGEVSSRFVEGFQVWRDRRSGLGVILECASGVGFGDAGARW